MEITTW